MSQIPDSQLPYKPPNELASNANQGDSNPKTSGLAIASLVFGLLSFVAFLQSFITLCLTGILGLTLGIVALVQISKSQGRELGKRVAIGGIVTSLIGMLLLPFLASLALQTTREIARSALTQNKMMHIGLAMHNYESSYMRLPSHDASLSQSGSTEKVSWRVKILPFLGYSNLYDQYDQTQPWDSNTNLALLNQMPPVYQCPNMNPGDVASGLTVYQVPCVDLNANPELQPLAPIFESGQQGPRFSSIVDGTDKTILLLEVDLDQAVPWTKPDDWEFDPNNPVRGLGKLRPGRFNASYADASTGYVPVDDLESIKAMFTRHAGD